MLTIKLFSNYIPKPEMPLWAEKLGAPSFEQGLPETKGKAPLFALPRFL